MVIVVAVANLAYGRTASATDRRVAAAPKRAKALDDEAIEARRSRSMGDGEGI